MRVPDQATCACPDGMFHHAMNCELYAVTERALEKAEGRIAAWLRACDDDMPTEELAARHAAADAIERGDHR